ncbi:hypothetical protein IE81DRAFT_197043 [Ceraceosorus guamensis]|uniref:Uncharacterized protein n=1 Tax=Ceraceosorus guamensis TaxID=1522189 RepID=A0A316VTV7_9BASI|nr:hypothetical protein IE81DRAFT_197043 [Ceraceosorus guamensis]PWN41009.1 hypothetical protein IE81DRAFT_197043 [Ceraceosorus guamensis]
MARSFKLCCCCMAVETNICGVSRCWWCAVRLSTKSRSQCPHTLAIAWRFRRSLGLGKFQQRSFPLSHVTRIHQSVVSLTSQISSLHRLDRRKSSGERANVLMIVRSASTQSGPLLDSRMVLFIQECTSVLTAQCRRIRALCLRSRHAETQGSAGVYRTRL